MAFEFADESDREVYAEWHRSLLERLFGDAMDLRYDLYEQTHSHRRTHNGGSEAGPCTAWPSPPYDAFEVGGIYDTNQLRIVPAGDHELVE